MKKGTRTPSYNMLPPVYRRRKMDHWSHALKDNEYRDMRRALAAIAKKRKLLAAIKRRAISRIWYHENMKDTSPPDTKKGK